VAGDELEDRVVGELTLTVGDIEDLAAKLNELESAFDDRQPTLLLAIFGLAGEALVTRRQVEVSGFGTPSVSEIVVTKPTDVATPHLGDALLPGPGQRAYLSFTMTDTYVTSISWSG
jgi:hypothetical protein